MKEKYFNYTKVIVYSLLFLLSIYRCFFGIDIDEEYTMLVSTQIADGYKMFGEVWASHQTSSFFMFPFIALWETFCGHEYIALLIRIVSVIIMFGAALLVENRLELVIDKTIAFIISALFFLQLPFGTISLSYSLLQMLFVSLTIVFYLLYLFMDNKKKFHLVLTGVFWSCAVLCYPYLAFITPLYFVGMILIVGKKAIKDIMIFCGTCLVCAAIFIMFVLSGISITEFRDSVINIFTDPSHSSQHLQQRDYFGQIPEIIKKLGLVVSAATGYFVAVLLLIKNKREDLKRDDFLSIFSLTPFAAYGVIMCFGNITGFYRSSCMGMSVGFLYFAITSLILSVFSKQGIQILIAVLGVAVYMVTFLQGAVGPKDYLGFLYLNVFLCVYQYFWFSKKCNSFKYRPFAVFAILLFSLSLLYTKAFCVRITGLAPSTTFEPRVAMKTGPLKGIYLDADEVEEREKKEKELADNSNINETYLLVDTKPLLNLSLKGKYIYVTSLALNYDGISTNPMWISYVNSSYHDAPTSVFLDRNHFNDEKEFLDSKMGQYLLSVGKECKSKDLENYILVSFK